MRGKETGDRRQETGGALFARREKERMRGKNLFGIWNFGFGISAGLPAAVRRSGGQVVRRFPIV